MPTDQPSRFRKVLFVGEEIIQQPYPAVIPIARQSHWNPKLHRSNQTLLDLRLLHKIELMPDTVNWGLRGEPNTIILLSGQSIKLPSKFLSLYPKIIAPSSEKLLFTVGGD